MQRWFFTEDPNNSAIRQGKGDASISTGSVGSFQHAPRSWLFRVSHKDLKKDEVACVVGDLRELGCWTPENVIPLQQEEDPNVWSTVIEIPDKRTIEYRYCVCVIIESGIQVVVRSWEANLKPRLIEYSQVSPTSQDEPEVYGLYNNTDRIDRGWLCKESVVQLKLCNNPLTLWRPKYANRTVYIKVTPVNLRHSTNLPLSMSEALDESLSDTQEGVEGVKFAFTEVAALNEDDPTFHPQSQFGIKVQNDDLLIFQSTILFPQNTAYLFDFYIYSSRCDEGEPPYHTGFSYLLPTALQSSEGQIILPVTSTKHRPLGELRVDYLVIGAMPNFKCDMSISYAKHWKKTRSGLDVGHRGSGSSFKNKVQNCAEVRENTIASLNNAINHGADFVEFDVQLSKDLVPIIYHDFYVCISMKKKKDLIDQDMLELPVKELTLDQLKMLKLYHLTEGKSKNQRFFDEDLEDHQPFPTLQQVLETLNPHVGFNIEIKWTMKLHDGSYELYHPTDLNLYLDTILEVVLRYGRDRRIIFSCFNPDICQVIRLKQNKYPVVFLTVGESKIYPKYNDPRCWSIKAAVQFASMIEILGINVHTEDLLRDPSLLKLPLAANLITFCWGDENADPATIKFLKQLGVHGVIYDKLHEYANKEVKESIFLLEARESQKELIQLAAVHSEAQAPPPPLVPSDFRDGGANIEAVRLTLPDNISTATSLESLESSASDYEIVDTNKVK
ncbi:glycerophosphocholine phosphodiesterase GPCPD1-like [Cylas formicarius]|uniref:glycerophosphocholine phosphodiesterase GPCPD1-like n=1 Tax=Cylas formicarius TaxID=197179 RepID=UPI002958656B|nr:glycerophosphocholine phosphodiesterase GPCPD1-like [Cylas formicarius]XP_060517745.1 glycerophosphocholine phosphodiesterase GPCPD1-like [Cylas formicarius]XP_060517746.1 glycerophosphocholine phosphodiesterase GPCPD1-like [Cylas formicarius]